MGGGLQVAQSICEQLQRHIGFKFIVVLSTYINEKNQYYGDNVDLYHYNIKHNFKTVLLGRDSFLDNIIEQHKIDAVLTVFGPSIWRPKVPHLCGFARAQLLLNNPLKKTVSLKENFLYLIWEWGFKKSSKVFYSENSYISEMLPKLLGDTIKVYTVSNYYNQIFDEPERWNRSCTLPPFDGITCLTVTSYSRYKNLEILGGIIKSLKLSYPTFKIRFVITFNQNEMDLNSEFKQDVLFIGKKDISEVPYLYEQCDIMFMPTLLECFTATYPEAMRMEKPIVTTDLEFARGLCGDAACYYSAIDADAAAEAIYKVATDKGYSKQLVENGKKRLQTYDNYEQRAEKLITILEEISR